MPTPSPIVLIVLDSWGLRPEKENNAIALAANAVYNGLLKRCPHAQLITSGEAVGLPAGQMGNSEVGHMNMGAGQEHVPGPHPRRQSIRDGELFESPVLAEAIDSCVDGQHALHFIGLLSDGGVHSSQQHLHALVEMAAKRRVPRVFVHVITDGRDTSPTGGIRYCATAGRPRRLSTGRVATMIGRYYAMDRDKRWERTRLAYDAIVNGIAGQTTQSPSSYSGLVTKLTHRRVHQTHRRRECRPQPGGTRAGPDSIVFFNFRADRARQLTRAIALDDSMVFVAHPDPQARPLHHDDGVPTGTFSLPAVFTPQTFSRPCWRTSSPTITARTCGWPKRGSYARVTYFFNSAQEQPYTGEDRSNTPPVFKNFFFFWLVGLVHLQGSPTAPFRSRDPRARARP